MSELGEEGVGDELTKPSCEGSVSLGGAEICCAHTFWGCSDPPTWCPVTRSPVLQPHILTLANFYICDLRFAMCDIPDLRCLVCDISMSDIAICDI